MIEKTGVIGGLDLPEQAEHSRERLEYCTEVGNMAPLIMLSHSDLPPDASWVVF